MEAGELGCPLYMAARCVHPTLLLGAPPAAARTAPLRHFPSPAAPAPAWPPQLSAPHSRHLLALCCSCREGGGNRGSTAAAF